MWFEDVEQGGSAGAGGRSITLRQLDHLCLTAKLTANRLLVEFDKTDTLFTHPADKRTEDYVTGRFG